MSCFSSGVFDPSCGFLFIEAEGIEVSCTLPFVGKIEGMFSVSDRDRSGIFRPVFRRGDLNPGDHFTASSVAYDELPFRRTSHLHGKCFCRRKIEIPVAGCRAIHHIIDVLVRVILAVFPFLGECRVMLILLLGKALGRAVLTNPRRGAVRRLIRRT